MTRALLLLLALALFGTIFAQEFDGEVDPHATRTADVEGHASADGEVTTPEGEGEVVSKEPKFDFKRCDFFGHSDDPKFQRLCEWAVKNKFHSTGLVKTRYSENAGVGVVATRDLKSGDEFFNVPVEEMVYTTNPHLSDTTQKLLQLFREVMRRPGYVAEDFELTEMAIIVMYERRNPESFFHPYLDTLQFPWAPLFMSEEKLKEFEYDLFTQYASYFVSDCLKNWRALLTHPRMEFARTPEIEQEFLWAASSVLQRSFDWGPDNRREYVMVPILDMVNHRFDITNNYYYSSSPLTRRMDDGSIQQTETPTGMVWAADKDVKEGEELFISYTYSSNNVQLLLQYGFVNPQNPYDYITFQINPPASTSDIDAQTASSYGLFHSIGVNGIVSKQFLDAVSFLQGDAGNYKSAYEQIQKSINESLEEFTTTLEADEESISKDDVSQEDFNILAYRIETKKLMKNAVNTIDTLIESIGKGETVDMKAYISRHEWPLRIIKVNVGDDAEELTTSARWKSLLM